MYTDHISYIDELIIFLKKYKSEINNKEIFDKVHFDYVYLSINNDLYNVKEKLLYILSSKNEFVLDNNIKKEVTDYLTTQNNIKKLYPFILQSIMESI
tara:strand:- start:423 stop:716 length:294 start_codon:yes stop_codon:yes gene_type:complete